MKLTQKTLFQCFDKSRLPPSAAHSSQNISPWKSEIQNSRESHVCQADFLLPIHTRQLNDPLPLKFLPLLKTRKLNDDPLSSPLQEFFRICPTLLRPPTDLPKLEFVRISSSERQLELFEQYTKDDELFVDWRSMFDSLQDYRRKSIEQNQYEQLLWTETYRPRNSKAYLGNQTQQIKRLNEWFSDWTQKMHNEQPKKVQRKKRKRSSDDEDFYDDDSNMSYSQCKSQHPQLIFIHGSGTTSLVHALAEEYHFKVTEINGSQSRARAPLLKQLEQVTSHHHLSFKRCPSDTTMSQEEKSKSNTDVSSPLPAKKRAKNEHSSITSYFKTKKLFDQNNEEQKENDSCHRSTTVQKSGRSNEPKGDKLTNKTNQNKQRNDLKQEQPPLILTENHFVSSVQVEKTSLILFDEIETLTTDDHFWSCLKKLLETAKKPIILTSNSRTNPEDVIINLSKLGHYELIHLEPHESERVYCFLRLILLTEMFEVPSLDQLIGLVQSCAGDLRRTLTTLQFLAQSSTIPADGKCSPTKKTSIIAEHQWQSSSVFDAMYHSHFAEQWNESSLNLLFDALTEQYTEEYDGSHKILANSRRNVAQRLELYDTFKLFMQEQNIENITERPSFYLDYRPYIRQMCHSEQIRATESNIHRRLRHALAFRGCSLQWSDFEILSAGIE